MIIDAYGLLSDAQAITVDAVSTNIIDFGNITPKRDPFNGEPMCLAFAVDVAADFTTTDEVYEFQAITSAGTDMGTPTILCLKGILAAALTAGSVHYLPLPPGVPTMLRYFSAYYNVGGTTPTLTITCCLQPQSMIQSPASRFAASGYSVS